MVYNTITSGIVGIFAFLDWCVYSLIGAVMEGLYNISETKILTNGPISDITDRLYIILGIFMLFKMAITMLKGIVNPDSINDKQAGMQKIIVRVITVLVLLLMVPTIFQFAYSVQGHALEALPQIILGPNESTNLSIGDSIASTVLSSFITPNDKCTEVNNLNVDLSEPGGFVSDVSSKCQSNTDDGNKIFQYNYTFIISTVVGIILIVLIVLISLDVAIRLIKLSILQIIAPIPIMTYIDPKSSKDGAFSNWSKECISTYISLFIQLGVVYFIVYLLQKILAAIGDGLQGEVGEIIDFGAGASTTGAKSWVVIFVVIAAFFFMKQAPKYLMKVLGIKSGAGLGVGLSAGLAGIGALAGGGGLLGTASALNSAISEGVEANAEGKSAFDKGGWKKGRDIAAQFKTGDPKATSKSMSQKFNDSIMSMKAASLGLTKDTVGDAKKAKFAAADALSDAQSMRTRFQDGGAASLSSDEQDKIRETLDLSAGTIITDQDMDKYVNKMNTNANKASSYFDKATRLANIYGVKTDDDLYDEFNPSYKAKKHSITNAMAHSAIDANRSERIRTGDINYDHNRGFNPNRHNPNPDKDSR